MILAVIFGVAFIASFFYFFGYHLDVKEHGVLRNLLIIFAFSSLLLIPNAIMNQEVCEPVINSTVVSGSVTSYTYVSNCFNPLNKSLGLLKAVNFAYYVFIAYIIVYLGRKSLLWLAESVKKRGGK